MKTLKVRLRYGVPIVLLLLVILFARSHWHELHEGIQLLGQLPLTNLAAACVLVCLTFVLAAMSYRMLAFRRLSFHELFTVELAATFINRLIPSGVGGLGIHGMYLHRRRHSIAQATAVVSTNNLLGSVVHIILLALLLLVFGNTTGIHFAWGIFQTIVLASVIVGVIIVLSIRPLRREMHLFLRHLFTSLRRYQTHPHMVMFAAIALLGLTLTNLLVLHIVTQALGIQLETTKLFIVYSAGVLIGTAIPTPGGLAGVETGLIAGFIAYGVPSDFAIAATLAFRLVTYWFPLIPGAVAFVFAKTQKNML